MNLRTKPQNIEKVTQAIFIIDESGSMANVADATINGINEQLQELKKHTDDMSIFVTLITFSGQVVDRFVNVPINEIPELTNENYSPLGSTALYDAVAHAILTERNRKYECSNVNRLVVIVTDGDENASTEYSRYSDGATKIADMITAAKTNNWTITYLGANQDLTKVAKDLNIDLGNIAQYNATIDGTKSAFSATRSQLGSYLNRVSSDARGINFYSSTGSQITNI